MTDGLQARTTATLSKNNLDSPGAMAVSMVEHHAMEKRIHEPS
jgi:hypothetical protein